MKRSSVVAGLTAIALLLGCAHEPKPEDIALEYARALYAGDLGRAYRLISTVDRRVKDEQQFLLEGSAATGFALEVTRQLASFIETTPLKTEITGDRAIVTLKARLPDANTPALAVVVGGWDAKRLNALSRKEREHITQTLDHLRRSKKLPMLDGEETFELVREQAGWRLFLNWAAGVRVRFLATKPQALPVDLSISPDEALLSPGERVHVTLRAANRSARDIMVRVNHRIEPTSQANSLALLQCALFIPVVLRPGQSEDFRSEYLLLKDVPTRTKQFQVTYEFSPVK